MARPRAADHDEKRASILERSAELFAAHGYDRASLNMLARVCGMSKALFYHYYTDKSQILFEIIHGHIATLLAVTDQAPEPADADPSAHLLRLSTALLEVYRTADVKHHLQLNQLHLLPPARQKTLKDMERQLVDRFAAAIAPCVSAELRGPALLKPLTMSLFGMLNWNYQWFRDTGPLARADYARLVVTLLVGGARFVSVESAEPGLPLRLGWRPTTDGSRPPRGR